MKKISTLYKKNPANLEFVIDELNPENEWVINGEGVPTRKFDGTASAVIKSEIYKRYDAKLRTGKKLKALNYYIDLLNIGTIVSKVSKNKFQDDSLTDEIVGFGKHSINGNECAILKNNGEMCLTQLKPIGQLPLKYYENVPDGAIPCQDPDPISGHFPHWIKCDRKNPEYKYHFEGFERLCKEVPTKLLDSTYELCGEKIQSNPEKIIGHILIKHGCEVLDECTYFTFNGLKEYLSNPNLNIEGIVFHHKSNDGRMCKIRKCDFGIKR